MLEGIIGPIKTMFCSFFNETLAWKEKSFRNRHVLITGGSSGLGLEIARQLCEMGADVTILARREQVLIESCDSIKCFLGKTPFIGQIKYLVGDVTDYDTIKNIMASAHDQMGRQVDDLFCCAGAAFPGLFIDQDPKIFADQMNLNYMGVVNAVHAFIQSVIHDRSSFPTESQTKGDDKTTNDPFINSKPYTGSKYQNENKKRIVMVSSTVGLSGMIGYSQYAPTKHAIRGLAECLQQELLPHGISCHVYYVGTIASPGHIQEEKTKPKITRILEEGDISDHACSTRASTLLSGVSQGHFAISSDFVTELFRLASLGTAPANSIFRTLIEHVILSPLAGLALSAWKWNADRTVLKHFGSI